MLSQNLIFNNVIGDLNNHTINWVQAADLINLNFYVLLQQFNESEHFRNNQYPYIEINPAERPGLIDASSVEELESALLSSTNVQIHETFKPTGANLTLYNTLFSPIVFTGDETVVRLENNTDDVQSDYMVLTPSVLKYCFCPYGWYRSARPQIVSTIVRYPLWSLNDIQQIDLLKFKPQGQNLVYEIEDLSNFKYSAQYHDPADDSNILSYTPTLEFVNEPVDSGDYYNPMPYLPSVHQDHLLGRIIHVTNIEDDSTDCCINVPITINRRYKLITGVGTKAIYTITIPSVKYPDGAVLELY